jgi:UDP-3-O-[3-hydroxymyristoyl] glucosamine N-acyltransferase
MFVNNFSIFMKLQTPISVVKIAEMISAKLLGNEKNMLEGINEIHMVEAGDLTFVDHPKYYDKSLNSAATIVLINKEVEVPKGKTLLISDDPFRDYVFLVKQFRPFEKSNQHVSSSAKIGEGTHLQPGVFVGNHAKIGKNCLIHANVSIYDFCEIGDNVIIHSGTVIGGDAFYYKKRNSPQIFYDKMESCGRVIIHDNVEIGSGCTIDKGVSGDTVIGWGTKIDNQVHIGHDTVVGKNCLFAAQVGIAGVTKIEDGVILWGQVGVNKDLVIGENAVVYAQSGVAKSIEGNKIYFGSPVQEAREKMKELALIKQLNKKN